MRRVRALPESLRRFSILGILCASGAWATILSAQQSSCPAGTRLTNRACVLDSDIVLADSLELRSATTLDCRSFRILPSSAGSGTTRETYVASVPAVAVAITGDRRVEVRNCIIGEDGALFDFGIIAINAKNAGKLGHRLHDNEIHARDAAITLVRVDEARVNDNVITWTNGVGVWLLRDSDRNRVDGNLLSSNGSPPAPIRALPGGPFREVVDQGVFVVSLHPTPLLNLVVGGQLYQFPNSTDGTYASTDDNVIEGNQLSLPGSSTGKSHDAVILAANNVRTRVAGNAIIQAGVGVRLAGLRPNEAVRRAARCVTTDGVQTQRFCQTDADCFIAGIDAQPVGICPTLLAETADLRGRDNLVEDNTLVGPFNATQAALRTALFGGNGALGCIFRRNNVWGTGTESGITLGGAALETGTVWGNVVQGAAFGIMLQQTEALSYGARLFMNDIIGSTSRAVGVIGTYTLPTELSWDGLGNYWDRITPPCFSASDSPLPSLIQDTYPFCGPIAESAVDW